MNELRLPLQVDLPHYPLRFFVRYRRFFLWLGFIIILMIYLFALAKLHPTNFFGQMEDDSLYFSSAREIGRGHGYIVPNLPGTPPATKYPILYPWILSWVWRLNPRFPDNLSWAVALNAGFGAMYLTASFVFLRRLKGLNDTAALILTAFCAIHPVILALSADLMSDISFAAFTLTACVLASKAIERTGDGKTAFFSGLLSGLSILLRTLGVPVALGMLVAIAFRGGWRKSTLFAASIAPFLFLLGARMWFIKPPLEPITVSTCAGSWKMTWLYYTSYTAYWKADALSNHVIWPILKNGVWTTLTQPGSYFVDPTGVRPALFAVMLLVFLSAIAIRGLLRQAQAGGWQPIHLALAFYLLPVLVWDYANAERFLIPFLPLLAAGMWIEGQHLVGLVKSTTRKQDGMEAKAAACFFCLIGCALLLGTALSWRRGTTFLVHNSQARASILVEKRQAYAWLRENTSSDAKVLAYEDASLFLYTGRQAMRPTIFSPAGYYRPEILDSELSCLMSSGTPIEAEYLLVSDDDFSIEWEPARSGGKSKEKEIEHSRDPLYRSSQGSVRIYKLDAQWGP
jgi:4-amino-4-deoxy-L-arabinose transferase-like glycosyltransferase